MERMILNIVREVYWKMIRPSLLERVKESENKVDDLTLRIFDLLLNGNLLED